VIDDSGYGDVRHAFLAQIPAAEHSLADRSEHRNKVRRMLTAPFAGFHQFSARDAPDALPLMGIRSLGGAPRALFAIGGPIVLPVPRGLADQAFAPFPAMRFVGFLPDPAAHAAPAVPPLVPLLLAAVHDTANCALAAPPFVRLVGFAPLLAAVFALAAFPLMLIVVVHAVGAFAYHAANRALAPAPYVLLVADVAAPRALAGRPTMVSQSTTQTHSSLPFVLIRASYLSSGTARRRPARVPVESHRYQYLISTVQGAVLPASPVRIEP
jgi:hypothetical protein